ncbi:hypothetical protein [Microcoleus sp. AT3-D2]|uniref:hypothetical protein n=1 Tax=Microcoleus sp. AT3-D2 TaxID=2818612 RepID=UPI002FD2DE7B
MSQQISQEMKDNFNQLVDSANQRGLSIRDFAIEVWNHTVSQEVNYVAFSTFLLETVTGLPGKPHIDEMVTATIFGNLDTLQAVLTVLVEGLVKYQELT